MAEEKIIIGAIVNNHFGVLMRITELFAKRCYNIDSLEVGITDDPALSRMTIVAMGDALVREQIVKQLSKLHDVRRAAVIPKEKANVREHMLIKLCNDENGNAELTALVNDCGAKVIDISSRSITVEVTGEVESNDAFIKSAKEFGILEICRAGAQALHRGSECLLDA
ncbi:MAG: acetolactate synthase small subunit [Coriobacteriales bacterium]|jgi:acetolactate synthase-1/3 small subunit|nr:acetolactate synthase small subunit [Coriobacteriales bacterium]